MGRTMQRPLLAAGLTLLLASCQAPPPDLVPEGPPTRASRETGVPPEALRPFLEAASRKDYPLYPGDLIRVRVQGHENLTIEKRIPASGEIPIYLESGEGPAETPPVVRAAGRRIPELEAELEKIYRRVVNPPFVTVTVVEYAPKYVYVAGAVKSPREYRLPDDKRVSLVQVLSMAGWFTDQAAVDRVRVIRVDPRTGERTFSPPIDVGKIISEGKADLDIVLEPGDTITVDSRESQSVYILGHVRQPGEFPWERGMTLTRLITLAGGLAEFAKLRDIRVMRLGKGPKPRVYHVDLQAVFDGEAADFPLRPGDRVWIDESWI